MRYYKLIYDYEQDDNYANCDVASIGNMDEYITISGKEIKQWGRVVFEYDSTEGNVLTDYLANPHRWFVVSENFCNKTQKILENQVQFLPVKVIDRFSGIEVDSYFVANIVTVIDALDLDNSKYDVFELDDEKIPPSKSLRRTQDPPALPAWSASPVSSPHNPRSPTPAGFPQSSSSVPGPSQISHEPQFFLCILYSDRIHIRVRALRSGSFFQTTSAPHS